MFEAINTTTQTVNVSSNVIFNSSKGCICPCIHEAGSGLFTLPRGKYIIGFGADVTSGTAGEVSLAIAVNGEPIIQATDVIAAANDVVTLTRATTLHVCSSSKTISLVNNGATALTVNDANLIVAEIGGNNELY